MDDDKDNERPGAAEEAASSGDGKRDTPAGDWVDKAARLLSDLTETAASTASKVITAVGDLNGDGKVDEADLDIALSHTRAATGELIDKAANLGREALESDMTRDVATGAAIGAAVAIPAPFVGPSVGAVVGAGVGLYKNLTRSNEGPAAAKHLAVSDLADELGKLDDLRQRGILTDDEFQAHKRKLLRRS